jgi:hypothetical protein
MDNLLQRVKQIGGGLLATLDNLGNPNIGRDPDLEALSGGRVDLANEAARRAGLAAMLQPGQPWYAMTVNRDAAGQGAYNDSITSAAARAEQIRKMRDDDSRRKRLAEFLAGAPNLVDDKGKPRFDPAQLAAIQGLPEDEAAKVLTKQLFPDPVSGTGIMPVADGYVDRDGVFHQTYVPRPANGPAVVLQTPEATKQRNDLAQKIATYQIAPPTGRQAYSAQGQAILQEVLAINPDYRAGEYASRNTARTRFTSGKQGDTIRSFNTALDHLATLQDLADALHNGDLPAVNMIANAVATQTGSTAPTNFDTAKKIVADEVTKAIVGGQMAQADREETVANIQNSKTPAQLRGAIDTFMRLMGGQLNSLGRQYEAATGLDDFQGMLSPEALPYMHLAPTAPAAGAAKTPSKIPVIRTSR